MKITVVTVCYNAAVELEETILSVLNQDYPNLEYIIIDGGSKDGSVEIIKKYANRLAYWISEPDKGIYDAMNKGIAAATGDYINFMNAGDKFASPSVLSIVAKEINEERPDVIYGNVRILERGVTYDVMAKKLDEVLAKRMPFCHQSTFVLTDYHKRFPFDTSFKCGADYNHFYNAYFRNNARFKYIPAIIAIYNDSEGFSKVNMKRTYRERYRTWGIEHDKQKVLKYELILQYRNLMTFLKQHFPIGLLKLYRK